MDSITVEDICQRPVQKAIQLAGVPIPGSFLARFRSAGGENWLQWNQAYTEMIKHVSVLTKTGRSLNKDL
jgi:hypothetical protein